MLGVSHKGFSQLFTSIIRTTVLESYKIWCCRTIHTSLSHLYYITPFCMYIFCDTNLLLCSVSYVLIVLRRHIQPNKKVSQQPILSLLHTHIVQNAAGERGQLSMEKCYSQMAKVRRTLFSHSLTPLSILSLPLSHSPLSFSLSPPLPLSLLSVERHNGVLRERFRDTKNNFMRHRHRQGQQIYGIFSETHALQSSSTPLGGPYIWSAISCGEHVCTLCRRNLQDSLIRI